MRHLSDRTSFASRAVFGV